MMTTDLSQNHISHDACEEAKKIWAEHLCSKSLRTSFALPTIPSTFENSRALETLFRERRAYRFRESKLAAEENQSIMKTLLLQTCLKIASATAPCEEAVGSSDSGIRNEVFRGFDANVASILISRVSSDRSTNFPDVLSCLFRRLYRTRNRAP